MKTRFLILILLAGLPACKHSATNIPMEKTIDYVFTCNLVDDPEVIKNYKYLHNEGMWPEVQKTFDATGASDIKIYIHHTRLVLIITLPERITFHEFQEKYNATSPDKIKEWDKIMASFQTAPEGGDPNGTWATMELMFYFKKCSNEKN